MECRLVKHEELSGDEASVYSVIKDAEGNTLLTQFIGENYDLYLSEIKFILARLRVIGNTTGAREGFFKLREGRYGDKVCALYDEPDSKLRLYAIRYGTQLIIVGGGGKKEVRALQEDDKLTKENYFLRELSNRIFEQMGEGDISIIDDGRDFDGNLTIYYED